MFSYIRRLESIFGIKNFGFQYIWGFQENEYFLGMKILWIFFFVCGGGHHKIGLYLGGGGISMYLGTFLEVKVQSFRISEDLSKP